MPYWVIFRPRSSSSYWLQGLGINSVYNRCNGAWTLFDPIWENYFLHLQKCVAPAQEDCKAGPSWRLIPRLGKQEEPRPTAVSRVRVPTLPPYAKPSLLLPGPEASSLQKCVKCNTHHKISFSNKAHRLSIELHCNEQRGKRNTRKPLAPPQGILPDLRGHGTHRQCCPHKCLGMEFPLLSLPLFPVKAPGSCHCLSLWDRKA